MRQRVDDDVAGLAVDGGDQALGANAPGQFLREGQVDRSALEERRSDDGVRGAALEHFQGARDRSDPAADAAGESGADARDQLVVLPLRLCRVEVDQLHLRPAAEPLDPLVDGGALERKTFALNELHDAPAHEID